MALRKLLPILLGSALFVAALCAIDVGSAVASTTEECKIPKIGEKFTAPHFLDSNCEKPGVDGPYHTVPYIEKPGVFLIRTATSPIAIQMEVAGVGGEIKCETYGGKKTAWNYEKGETMGFEGEGTIKLSGCAISKPAGCTISPTIESVKLKESSEDLLELMRTVFQPVEGSKFASFTISGCAISGTYTIEGKLRSQTVSIHTEEFGPETGSELTIGKAPVLFEFAFHDATEADGKTTTRETP